MDVELEHQTVLAPHLNGVPSAAASSGGTASVTPSSHPSYREMIRAAIEWGSSQGKEGGSSKNAISKYIERVYTDLPLSHSALLNHHLARLKKSGQLIMVKNSYELSSPSVVPGPGSTSPAKRGRGRPPKEKSDNGVGSGSVPTSKTRGRPPKVYQQGPVATEVPFVQPISQKRRGRPPKLQGSPQALAIVPFVPQEASQTSKRPPGRPRKYASSEVPVPLDRLHAEGSVRPRGRPRKNVLGPMVSKRPIGKRPVGRPRKKGGAGSVGALGIRIGMGMRRGRGRPPKGGGPAMMKRRPSGLVGRPRKDANNLHQKVANEELLRKFELFQSKVREAVIVIRPYIADENPASTALKQLEEMAKVNLTESPNAPPSPPEMMTVPESTLPIPVVPISIAPPSTASPTANFYTPWKP